MSSGMRPVAVSGMSVRPVFPVGARPRTEAGPPTMTRTRWPSVSRGLRGRGAIVVMAGVDVGGGRGQGLHWPFCCDAAARRPACALVYVQPHPAAGGPGEPPIGVGRRKRQSPHPPADIARAVPLPLAGGDAGGRNAPGDLLARLHGIDLRHGPGHAIGGNAASFVAQGFGPEIAGGIGTVGGLRLFVLVAAGLKNERIARVFLGQEQAGQERAGVGGQGGGGHLGRAKACGGRRRGRARGCERGQANQNHQGQTLRGVSAGGHLGEEDAPSGCPGGRSKDVQFGRQVGFCLSIVRPYPIAKHSRVGSRRHCLRLPGHNNVFPRESAGSMPQPQSTAGAGRIISSFSRDG